MRNSLLFATLLLLAGCDHRAERELGAALAAQQRIAAERDSLLDQVLATTELVDSINLALTDARIGVSTVTAEERQLSLEERRRAVLGQVREAVERLDSANASLDRARARITSLEHSNSRLLAQVSRYQTMLATMRATTERQIGELQATIDSQRTEIATLKVHLDTARVRTRRLEEERAAILDTLNTVYVISGRKDSLIKLGVVVNEGSKFLFFGGKTLQPSRTLDATLFRSFDRLRDSVIPLPRSDKRYRIVTRQSPEFLASEVTKDGKVRGALRIASPEQFWAPSRYLILVEQ